MAKKNPSISGLVSVAEAAKTLNRPKMTIYRWARAKKIESYEVAGLVCIPKKEVERLQKEGVPKE